ncbi:MAG: YqhA family protein [Anaerolineae bacterium]|nr:YqhA family protein [Anaerolineae bacterium]
MKTILENSKFLMLGLVLASLVATLAAFVWAVYETAQTIINLVTNYKSASSTIGSFVQLMDIFLLVAVLYILTVTIYELFIGDLDLPKWLIIHNFDQLKTILLNMVVLILAVSFLKFFQERNDPSSTLLYGLAVAVVAFALIRYREHGHADHANDDQKGH